MALPHEVSCEKRLPRYGRLYFILISLDALLTLSPQAIMKFADTSPDIPIELIRRVNDGDVVFLCGAGVSKDVGLPLFRKLTDDIYTKLGESKANEAAERIAYDRTEYDRVLRSLEKRTLLPGADSRVRAAVGEILTPPVGADLSRHLSLQRLSRR